MAAPQFIIIPAMPLRSFWALLPEDGRKDWDQMVEGARKGRIAGTYKQGGEWWINLIAHTQLGLESDEHGDEAKIIELPQAKAQTQGDGNGAGKGRKMVRQNQEGRGGDVDRRVRHRR